MDPRPAYDVAAGSIVAVERDGRRLLCLKAERAGKEHVNHFLVPLEPVDDRSRLALVYIDPDERLAPVEGVSFAFEDGPEGVAPQVGDAFTNPSGALLKVMDDPRAQRLHAYVDLATGQIRARMERGIHRLLTWRMQRI